MVVLWRYRLATTIYAVLAFIVCDAQVETDAPVAKLMYPRGNHWAVGHLMGKKSLDYDRDGGERYFTAAQDDEETDGKPSGLLRALITVLAGSGSETGNERESTRKRMPNRDAAAQSRLWEEQLTRARELTQTVRFLLMALRSEDHES